MVLSSWARAALLLSISYLAAAHGRDMDMSSSMNNSAQAHTPAPASDTWDMPSYAGLPGHSSSMVGHVGLMVLAWFFVLPIGLMFSISRSKLLLPTHVLFLVLNGLGVLFSTHFTAHTPDLYENNAHHALGWICTWIMTAEVVMALIFYYSGHRKVSPVVQNGFLPVSVEAMAQHNNVHHYYSDYRWSGDSGQGTERSSRDVSPNSKPEPELEDDEGEEEEAADNAPERRGFLHNTRLDKYLSRRLPGMFSKKLLKTFEILYVVIERTILVLGFVTFLTGGVTYTGIFRKGELFSGLAHFIKGGIFFWYGLLTLGRWVGCFADFGWAWNIKPTRGEVGQWKAAIPSAEFTESFVIWLYGCTNVFLEHLAAWGDAWSAQDLEHVAISVMFFGGGLCGMLVESTTIREWLNTQIEMMPVPERHGVQLSEAQESRSPPRTYSHSMNVMPGLIILLLGVMMSSHHQESMTSTMIHSQWGTLLVGFSLARGVTYIITYISPPTSVFASRPPSELISSFCLIAGGIIFMASAKDTVHLIESRNLHAMFLFTITMGFTAFLMAWTMIVLGLKGWAARREQRAALTWKY